MIITYILAIYHTHLDRLRLPRYFSLWEYVIKKKKKTNYMYTILFSFLEIHFSSGIIAKSASPVQPDFSWARVMLTGLPK